MSHRGLLLSLAALLVTAGFTCRTLSAQDVRVGGGPEYPQGQIATSPEAPGSQVPMGRAPKPVLLGHSRVGPAAPTFPYGYFGAQSHYHWNSHFSTQGEYMFWRPGLRPY
jgi:hypothetical protein